MKRQIHIAAAIVATLCIATFFISTVLVELFGNESQIQLVKSLIVLPGLFLLIPAMALTGMTGFLMSKNRKGKLLAAKQKRMPFIAINGLLVLLTAALYLNHLASAGTFDSTFYIVQIIELIAGAINLSLMSLNIRDGRKLAGR